MTLTLDRATPWELLDMDPEAILADLQIRFPGICMWHGEFTGRYFAAVLGPSRYDRLVEAATPGELIRLLTAALGRRPEKGQPEHPVARRPMPDPCQNHTIPVPRGHHKASPGRGRWQRLASLWSSGCS